MNNKIIGKVKRLISGFVAAATAITVFPAHFAMAEEVGRYPYTLFAASSEEGAITVNAGNFCVNGNVATNGTLASSGNMNINGTKTENAGLDMIYVFDKIDSRYFSGTNVDEHSEDYTLDEINININEPTEVYGEAELTGNININTALKAFEDITLNGEVKNTNDSVIFSKYGDIVIDSTNVNLNGLVYAPFGSVKVKAMNLNLNNVVIIADSIVFDCPNVNANYSTNAADFVGTISEPLNIPKDEWQYMKDENGNGLPDFFEDFDNWEKLADTDGDGLPDSIEEYLGSDSNNIDTDGDGLGDYYEVFVTYTDPTMADTDENGVSDADEDFDEDNLTNFEEFINKTNPYIDDMDNDGLSDGDEIKVYGTDPLVADTDGDELEDGDEIILGTNPLVQDTDGDGIIDSKEKFQQTFTHKVKNEDCAVTEVIVDMECTGNINKTTSVESVMNVDMLCTDVVGLIGEPFEIETESEFDKATLTFRIDKDKLGEIPFDNLLFLWYNEEEDEFVELETTLNEVDGTASIVTTHFSKYMVVDKYEWYKAWAVEFDYNPTGGASGAPTIPVKYNTVLAIDCSGSMDWNDHISIKSGINSAYDALHPYTCNRITAAEGFIRYMNSDDETAIVFFTDSADAAALMTNDKEVLKLALQKMYSNGGTSFSAALNASIAQIDRADKITNGVNKNRIILLSDGDDNDSASMRNAAIQKCKDKFIEVYTVGFGSANDAILQKIADETKGKYYRALDAKDIVDIFARFGYMDDFDMTDTDGDGLPDAVETAGIRLQNGIILQNVDSDGLIFTDPTNPDTDGDGLLDGEEIDPTPYLKTVPVIERDPSFCGPVLTQSSYYFKANSDPRKKDSDGDGYADGPIDSLNNGKFNDPRRLLCDVFVYKISDSENFVQVYDVGGNRHYGGDQSWIKNSNFNNKNIYADGGCAVAATCDLLLYLKRTNMDFPCEIDFDELGINNFDYITQEQYVKLFNLVANDYVKPVNFLPYKEYLEREQTYCSDGIKRVWGKGLVRSSFYFFKSLLNLTKQEMLNLVTDGTYTWGVMPWDYSNEIEQTSPSLNTVRIDLAGLSILSRISLHSQDYNYSDYISDDYCEKVQGIIISSLENNVPVTLMYGLGGQFDFRNWNDPSILCDERKVGGHYINVTELIVDKTSHDEYMKIASWGESYYLKYDSFMRKFGVGGSVFIHEIE